jgi:2-polyprenyl-3-methyl-5-hydroxy-6-metoxy-1,4-benzoquinol methylase
MAFDNVLRTTKPTHSNDVNEKLSHKDKKKVLACLNTAVHYFDCAANNELSTQQSQQFLNKSRKKSQTALSIDINSIDALNLLSRIELENQNYSLSQTYLNQALIIEPDHSGLLFSQGHIYLANEQYQKAIDSFSLAESLDPGKTRALSSIAFCLLSAGNYPEAFQYYRKLIPLNQDDLHIKSKLFECCDNIKADYYDEILESDLLTYFDLNDVDYNQLARLSGSLICHKYTKVQNNALAHAMNDNLLIETLNKTYFRDQDTEKLITSLRHQLLLEALSNSNLSNDQLRLILAFSQHSFNNGYILPISSSEDDLLQALNQLFESANQSENFTPNDIAGALIIYAMYYPLHKLPIYTRLKKSTIDQWPSSCTSFFTNIIASTIKNNEFSKNITTLSNITNDHSQKVQSQYEEHPYPRWLTLGHNTPTNYGKALEQNLIDFSAPQFFDKSPLQVLIAGCGTGRHALKVARSFRNTAVTAIDLSRASLAYVSKMSKFYNIENIDLYQADLLSLNELKKDFHVIECSGVLHHMADPEAGLSSLVDKLMTNGVIKIGLYSRQARKIITDFRAYIENNNITPDDQQIRHLRQLLMNKDLHNGLANTPDFFSMSGCRDLLFHEYERQYTPKEIEQLCQHCNLRFLGFVGLSTQTVNAYRAMFSTDKNLTSLSNWQEFEEKYPDTFSRMFQFYCQKTDNTIRRIH